MSRGRPKTFDAERALDAAVEVLWREGVNRVSLNELAERVGAPKPAIARAFGGKDAFTAEALRHYHRRIGTEPLARIEQAESVGDLAEGFLTATAMLHTEPGRPLGCLVAIAHGECATVREGPIRAALDEIGQFGVRRLRDRLAEVGADDPEGVAEYLVGQTFALSQMARAGLSRSRLLDFVARAVAGLREPDAAATR